MQLPTLTFDQEDKSSGSAILRGAQMLIPEHGERAISQMRQETCLPTSPYTRWLAVLVCPG